MRFLVSSLTVAALVAPMVLAKDLLVYEVNLDLAPELRYEKLIKENPAFNDTVWTFYQQLGSNHPGLLDVLYRISDKRGAETEELQKEIEGLAAISKLPLEFVKSIQMLYEIQTVMIPIVNFSHPSATGIPQMPAPPQMELPPGYEALADLPWRGPGCTGIIATGYDGTVYHARNLDFAPTDIMSSLVYDARFTKGGKEIFRSQMIAGYTMVITGASLNSSDGFAIERNTRYGDHVGAFKTTLANLESGRDLNGWSLRKILETETDFEAAVLAITATKYASPEYAIVSGVKKGTILAHGTDGVAHVQTLGQPNHDSRPWDNERTDFIIITNFDFFWHDVREWFDPTGGYGIGHPRRLYAEKQLNAAPEGTLTPQYLYETLNNKGVFADTVFQAIINVEQGLWNVSIPDVWGSAALQPPQ